tara:strand:- start:592 stop:1059 length:468 start_codon:yes stop_codon:yes gene_type:complete
MKLKKTMKKLLFILFTVFSISCQINTNSSKELEKIWLTDVSQAIEQSKVSGKPIFAFFTGKEWCSWCKKLEYQVLSKEEFINYAKNNLVLLELDFPRGRRNLPQKQIELARKFNIKGYPTVILMDSSTNKIAKTGYESMSPEQYVDHVKTLLRDY